MENAYPGSNILVVTLTNEQSKRVEAQSDQETMKEAMSVLRDMFGSTIPYATDILVPRWWNNRFQRGSYSNYPMISDNKLLQNIKVTHLLFLLRHNTHVCQEFKTVLVIQAPVGRIFFTGEHTSEKFSGYVHGGYLAGMDTSKSLLEEMNQSLLLQPLLVFTESLTLAQQTPNSQIYTNVNFISGRS